MAISDVYNASAELAIRNFIIQASAEFHSWKILLLEDSAAALNNGEHAMLHCRKDRATLTKPGSKRKLPCRRAAMYEYWLQWFWHGQATTPRPANSRKV